MSNFKSRRMTAGWVRTLKWVAGSVDLVSRLINKSQIAKFDPTRISTCRREPSTVTASIEFLTPNAHMRFCHPIGSSLLSVESQKAILKQNLIRCFDPKCQKRFRHPIRLSLPSVDLPNARLTKSQIAMSNRTGRRRSGHQFWQSLLRSNLKTRC